MGDNPIIFLVRHLWRYSKGNRGHVVLYFVLFLFANGVNLIEPFVVAHILDVMQAQGITSQSLPTIVWLSSSFIFLQFAFWIFHGPARVIENENAFLVRAHFKMFLLGGTLGLPAAWHTDHHSGDTIDKIEKGTNALYLFSSRTFEIIESFARLATTFLILVYFDLYAGFIVTATIGITAVIILAFDKRLIDQYTRLNRFENGISAKIFDVISNVTTVIILRIENLVSGAIRKSIHEPFALYRRNVRLNEAKWFLVSLNGAVMVFAVLCSYFYANVAAGVVISIGSVYLLYSYVQRVTDVFFRFTYQYGDLVQQKTAVLNAEELSQSFQEKKRIVSMKGSNWKELRVEALSFSYHTEEGADLHLDDVSMTIRKGERIALIGESGSGKTTFLKLLRGLYPARSVEIFLDGRSVKDGLTVLSPQMALIPQDPEIFSTTIRENITVGVDHSLATVRKYADLAQFTEVAERLPKQWESSIVEKGVNLSGGEKQRLALARGLLACAGKEKRIILLDEPTSSVDMKNEWAIYQNIFRAFEDKAIISSIHRLHLLPAFDRIYFFRGGRVIASGSFEDLLEHSPPFRALWKKYRQAQKNLD